MRKKPDQTTVNYRASRLSRPRKRAQPLWRSRAAGVLMGALVLAGAGGGGWYVWQSGWVSEKGTSLRWNFIAFTGDLGFRVNEILVTGRRETPQAALLDAVRLARGAPILAYDLDQALKRVERLPWVRRASVERMLPDTIMLTIEERKPLALWQNKGRFVLIDEGGEAIPGQALKRFAALPIVVGPDAPANAQAILDTLRAEPSLMAQVKALTRVGGRRWNVRLKNGIDVRLPETDAAAAWARLAEYERNHKVLKRDVRVLDLRMPDRLIVREQPKARKTGEKSGRQT